MSETSANSRLYPARPLLAVSVACFRDGKVLLATRTRPPALGALTLPGGLVEPGERLTEAALRELREEVEVEAEIVGFNGHAERIDRDGEGRVKHHYVITSFVARWLSGEPQPGAEAGEIVWADPHALEGLPLTDGLRALLRRAATMLESTR
ncbi:MAG TPA: NUDIX domain-containing protein [Beijerinckiaceae bacterium]|jgi:8-oxo-dGTP diphosphatase|nr:NUDIX domain-containing protein [Beijerinckiaceae bacterium]